MRYLPIFMDMQARTVLVVGGGEEALRKIRMLLKTPARIKVVAERLHEDIAREPRVEWIARAFDPGLVTREAEAGLSLIYAADPALHAAVASAARSTGIPVNAVDAPELSSFITPSIVDRDPLVVAVGTEGAAPVLAVTFRARIDALLPPGIGALVRAAAALRERVAGTLPSGNPRRAFWRNYFFGPASDAFASGDAAGYEREVSRALADHLAPMAGRVSFLPTPRGDSELITLKAQRRLLEADVIIHSSDTDPGLLALARRDAVRLTADEEQGSQQAIAHAAAGDLVVRISARLDEVSFIEASGVAIEILETLSSPPARSVRHRADIVPFPLRNDIRDAIMRAAS